MVLTIKCKEIENREDYYFLEISSYKQKIEGRFERSELRKLLEQIDESINVGLK